MICLLCIDCLKLWYLQTLEMISQNPGNPNFIHYCFECIAGLTRYLCSKNPSSYLPILETKLFPFFQVIFMNSVKFSIRILNIVRLVRSDCRYCRICSVYISNFGTTGRASWRI
jgi:hypothetical protein